MSFDLLTGDIRAAKCGALAMATAPNFCLPRSPRRVGVSRSATQRPPGPDGERPVRLDATSGADADTIGAPSPLCKTSPAGEQRHRRTRADVGGHHPWFFGEFHSSARSRARIAILPAILGARRPPRELSRPRRLYLANGERIGVPLDGILLPGHFLRADARPAGRNLELLRR